MTRAGVRLLHGLDTALHSVLCVHMFLGLDLVHDVPCSTARTPGSALACLSDRVGRARRAHVLVLGLRMHLDLDFGLGAPMSHRPGGTCPALS